MSSNTNWVNNYQNPFDQKMKGMADGPDKNTAMQQYQDQIKQYGAAGGDQAKTAAGAQSTFDQYYHQSAPPSSEGPATPPGVPATPPPADPWAHIADAYGLGAPPAQGMPAVMPGVQIGNAPQVDANAQDQAFQKTTGDINSKIGDAYNYQTPQAQTSLINKGDIQQPGAQQVQQSDQLMKMASGQGYDPAVLAKMKANATQTAATAGTQQMGQMKRLLGQSGVRGNANAAVQGDIVRQTGQAQGNALNNIDINDAGVGNENAKFGVGQQTQIAQGNMQEANSMALSNANRMFQGLQANQNASNQGSQFNTGLQAQQQQQRAGQQGSFLGQQGQQQNDQRFQTGQQNANMNFQRQNDQAGLNWDKQKSQWQELNNRYGQSTNVLGSMGSGA